MTPDEVKAFVARVKEQAEKPADTAGFAPFRQCLRDCAAALEEGTASPPAAADAAVAADNLRERLGHEHSQALASQGYMEAMVSSLQRDLHEAREAAKKLLETNSAGMVIDNQADVVADLRTAVQALQHQVSTLTAQRDALQTQLEETRR